MLSRRDMVRGAAAAGPGAALAQAFPAAAAAFEPTRLIGPRAAWAELEHVNRAMGPTRLTGSPEHQAFVGWIGQELRRAVAAAGGQVFEDRFENYPRWSAQSWSLEAAARPVPVSSYFPYCTGGFTGRRSPLKAAPALAAAGSGGDYPKADGETAAILEPSAAVEGVLIDLGLFTGPGSVDWSKAAGKIALVWVSVEALSNIVGRAGYKVDGTWADGRPDGGPYVSNPAPTGSIFAPPDIPAATRAGVKGVVLVWKGISAGNADGQYNPFTVPFSSWPASSPEGSDPARTLPGIPALWVNEGVGGNLAQGATAGASAKLRITARIEQVSTATVWALLPGARYGETDDEILICNTHSDGPNITEENGGLAVVNMARYFAGLPRARRPKTMVFMASTGHFGHRFLGSGRDWIVQHPQIMVRAAAVLTLEHLGCLDWQDETRDGVLTFAPTGGALQSQIFVTAPRFQARAPGPADPALRHIAEGALASTGERAAILSGGAFLGEGGGFHAAGVPTIGFLPSPQYLCAMAPDGEISKLDPAIYHRQLRLAAECLLALQTLGAADLKGAG